MLNSLKFTLLAAVTLGSLLQSANAQAESGDTKLGPSRIVFEKLSAPEQAALWQSVQSGDVLDLMPRLVSAEVFDKQLADVWTGNRPILEPRITEIGLKFVYAGTNVRTSMTSSYEISFLFEEAQGKLKDIMVVRSSHPRNIGERGGIRLPLLDEKVRKFWLQGQPETGFVISVPKLESASQVGWLVCPRDLGRMTAGDALPILWDTGFQLQGIRIQSRGQISGKLLSGLEAGRSRAQFLTSLALPKSISAFDEAISKDPQVDVKFEPDYQEEFFPVDSEANVAEGIKALLDMQTPAGYRRQLEAQDIILIKRINLTDSLVVKAKGLDLAAGTGTCYLLLKQQSARALFSKEELSKLTH